MMSSNFEGERSIENAAQEIAGINMEAAALLEHISETKPRYRREELLEQAIKMIDDAHELAIRIELELEEKESDDPCLDGYVQDGTVMKDGEEVPNCVPVEEARNND